MYGFLKNLRFFDAFFILFLVDKGITFTQIGMLYAIREIITNLFEIPSGIFADSFGRKRALAGSFILYISSFTLFYLFGSFWLFMIAFVFFGLAEAFRSGTHKGMIMDYLKLNGREEQAADYYGHTRAWSQMGSALSALMAGFIVFYGGSYESIFLYSIIPYLLNFILIISYPAILDRTLEPSEKKQLRRLQNAGRMLFGLLKELRVLKIIYSSAAHTAYLRAIKDYIQLVMVNLALVVPVLTVMDQEQKSGIFIGILYFVIYLASANASRLSSQLAKMSRYSMTRLTLVVSFLLGVISGLCFHIEFWILALLAFALIYVMENIRKPLLTGAIADEVPKEILTSVISAQSLLRTITTALLALVFGILADQFGVGISLLSVSALLLLSSLFIPLRLKT
jgi:MFS family permease